MSKDIPPTEEEKKSILGLIELRKELAELRQILGPTKVRVRRARGPRKPGCRCPKCRSRPFQYIELWKDHSIEFQADENGNPEAEGNLRTGDPYKVVAECSCGHIWTLKNITQISDIERVE